MSARLARPRTPPHIPSLTIEEALDLQVADTETQHGQLVQPSPDLVAEGQQAGELVQLAVQTVAVAFGWVGFDAIGRGGFGAADKEEGNVWDQSNVSSAVNN